MRPLARQSPCAAASSTSRRRPDPGMHVYVNADDPEEDCDDGNKLETDACLNSCSWRVPSAHGIGGCA